MPSDRREQWHRYSDRREDIAGRSVRGPLGISTAGRYPEAAPEPGGLPLRGRGIVKHRPKGDVNEPLG